MRRGLWSILAALSLTLGSAMPLAAQSAETATLGRGSVISPVLTIDSERLFRESAFGRRVAAETEARGAKLNAENRKIEADLEAEELELTEKRTTMSAEEFGALADAFDEKVQRTRAEQDAKRRALNEDIDTARETFLTATAPALEQLMRDSEAAVILDVRAVFASISAIEITDEAIALIDESLGDGLR